MDLVPAIRTPQTGDSRANYEIYLKTPAWRSRRNAALKRVFWQCERCGARRSLEVHHKTYERLGYELPNDLEVLCRDCHEGEHVQQMHDDPTGRVYLKLAREVIRSQMWDSFADLVEAMKVQCARLKLPYDTHQVDKALGLLSGETKFTRVPATDEARTEAFLERRVFTPDEARACLLRLFERDGVNRLIKTMPAAKGENPTKIDIYGPVPNDSQWGDHDRY